MVGTNQLDGLVRAIKDVVTDGSNSDIIDQNRVDINNLLDFLTKSSTTRSETIKSTAEELLEYVRQIPSAKDNISVVKTGGSKSSGSQDSDVGTSSDADKQQKQLNRDKKEIEDKLNNLPYVAESIIVQQNEKLVGLVYPDFDDAFAHGLQQTDIEKAMEANRNELNLLLPAYCQITKVKIHFEEFEKTAKKSIKRFMYQEAKG